MREIQSQLYTAKQLHDMPGKLLAVSIALQHAEVGTDPQLLCAAAQTCKGLRQAVQQRSACSTVVVLSPDTTLHQLRSFASWLTGHAHLVSSITADSERVKCRVNRSRAFNNLIGVTATQKLLKKALTLAAKPAAAAAAAAAAATALRPGDAQLRQQQQQQRQQRWQQRQQQQQQLRLTSFSSNYATLAMLKSLPTHSLTRLQFDLKSPAPAEYLKAPNLLASFSNLQQLQLENLGNEVPGSFLASLGQLGKLTQLHIKGDCWVDSRKSLQQLLSQPPPLLQLRLRYLLLNSPLDFTALTQLQELVSDELHPDSVLPAHLPSLILTGVIAPDTLRSLSGLQQLRCLNVRIDVDRDATQNVLQLALRLPTLTHLALKYTYPRDAALAARTWQELPQLRELSFDFEDGVRVHRWQMDDLLAGVAAATSLTKLEVEAYCAADTNDSDEDADETADYECAPVAVCASLSRLTALKDLTFSQYTWLVPGDALRLTALTNLTRLVLFNMRDGVGDAAAAAIVQNLTQLRHLDLRFCELGQRDDEWAACLETIEKLVHLTELQM